MYILSVAEFISLFMLLHPTNPLRLDYTLGGFEGTFSDKLGTLRSFDILKRTKVTLVFLSVESVHREIAN